MATRQEIQIAQDLIRFINIINDLLDCLSWQLQGIDPNDGGVFMVTPSTPIGEDPIPREPTVDDLKVIVTRTTSNIKGYRRDIRDYIQKGDTTKIVNGLNALGVDKTILQQEMESMSSICDFLVSNLPSVTTKEQLAQAGQYIDNNVPKLKLVRRSWDL